MNSASDIADQLLRDLAPVDPDAASALGLEPDNIMPALGPGDFAARREAYRRAQRSLDALGTPAPAELPLGLALRERVDAQVALDDTGFSTAQLAPLATPIHQVREVFDNLPHETPADWERVAEHLARVPATIAAYTETLRAAADAGHVMAARQVLGVAAQCESWTGADGFYRQLVATSGAQRSGHLDTGASAAVESMARFAGFLRGELLPPAPRADGVGRDLYTVTSRAFLGEDVDLAETYAFGWAELAQLTAEMRQVAAELGHDSIEAAAAALDADPARRLSTPDELTGWLQSRIDDVTNAVDGVHFDLPAMARRAECRISTSTSGIMYYSAPDPSFSRPGRVWWSPPADGTSHTWREVTTVHHEAVPGHHLQVTVAMTEPALHPWQRSMAHVHGYVEGWAHYAERLAGEFGLLHDPGERLGMLYGQRWRAARIVIDMGLHLGLPIPPGNGFTEATDWTPAAGVAMLREAARADETTARFEVDRYLGWPAQALAFRVGARLWRRAREAAERRPGFDLCAFHMHALRLGPLGLGPLREVMS